MISTDCQTGGSSSGYEPVVDPASGYKALWNNPNYGMYILDVIDAGADFRFVAFNAVCTAFCTAFCTIDSPIHPDRLTGCLLSEAFSADVFDRYHRHCYQCVGSGQPTSFEEKLPVNHRTTYWQLTVCPVCDCSGIVSQLIVMAVDVTAQKQDSLLRESQEILQQVIDTMPAAIFWKDTESRYLGCNRAFAKLTGLKDVTDIIGKDDYDMVWNKAEAEQFRERDRNVMLADKPEFDVVEPQLHAKGRQTWLRTSKIPLHDVNGTVNGILSVIEDVTDRKEAQDKQARLLAILEATPDIISITDACGYHRYLNQAGQRMFNISSEQAQFFNLADMTHSDAGKASLVAAFADAREKGIWTGESVVRNCYGQDIPVSHVIISHGAEGNLTERFSSIMRDISDRKAAETQLKEKSAALSATLTQLQLTQSQIIQAEKMSSLGQMVAGVAHEINNPVNFIYGNLEPAADYTQDLISLIDLYAKSYTATPEIEAAIEEIELDFVREDLPKILDSMAMGAERIQEIVLSLRNFSRLDEAAIKTVDLHEGIDSTLVILNHRLKSEHSGEAIEVVKCYGNLSPVACYPSHLNQALMNILANAIDALAAQLTPRITITTESQNGAANIRIRDNGMGIPADVQAQIFDPFFTTKCVGKGTGMGLSISYQIVTEKHGGQLTFVSQLGQGTEFLISIPIAQIPGETDRLS